MYVFRMRVYDQHTLAHSVNDTWPRHKIEAVSEKLAQKVADWDDMWIYFFATLDTSLEEDD